MDVVVSGLDAICFGIFMMRQFMFGVPKDLLDAARVDGAPEPYIYGRIMLPLCKPAIAALTIFAFLGSWDNFLWPLIVINSKELWTLPIAMSRFTEQYISQTHLQMAGASLMFLPVLIVFLIMQRDFRGHCADRPQGLAPAECGTPWRACKLPGAPGSMAGKPHDTRMSPRMST